MVATVSRATLQLQVDPSGFVSGAKTAEQEAEKLASSITKVTKAVDVNEKELARSVAGFQRWLGTVDKSTRESQGFLIGMQNLTRFKQAGVVSDTDLMVAQNALREKFAAGTTAVNDNQAALGKLRGVMSSVSNVAAALGVGLSVGALVSFGKEAFTAAASLSEAAEQAGVSVEGFQALRAEMKFAGIATEDADRMMTRLTRSIGEAQEGSSKQRDAFIKLGISANDLAGGTESVLPMVAAALLKIPNAAERASIEVALFSRSGQKLESALRTLADPIATLIEKNKALGFIMGKELADTADKTADRMGAAWGRAKVAVGSAVTYMLAGMFEIIDAQKRLNDQELDIEGWVARGRKGQPKTFGQQREEAAKNAGTPITKLYDGPYAFPKTDNKQWSQKEADDVMAQMRAKAGMAGLNETQRAQATALIDYANALFKEDEKIYTVRAATALIGKESVVSELKMLAARTVSNKEGEAEEKRRKTHANDFQKHLSSLDQEIAAVRLTSAERREQATVIKAAQELQKQTGVEDTKQVQTYSAALAVLKEKNAVLVQQRVLAKELADFEETALKRLKDQGADNALPAHLRSRASQIRGMKEGTSEEVWNKSGTGAVAQLDANLNQPVKDYIADLEKSNKLIGMSSQQREIALALDQQMVASGGTITEGQKAQIANLIDIRQRTQDWADLQADLAHSFSGFFRDVIRDGKLSFQSLADSILDIFADMLAQMAARWMIEDVFGGGSSGGGGLLGGLFGGLGGVTQDVGGFGVFGSYADGGPVRGGGSYMVGENGPEVFTPNTSGMISPNSALGKGGITIVQNINAPGATPGMEEKIAVAARNAAAEAVQAAAPSIVAASYKTVSNRMQATGRGSL